jgi:hypothetical protein
MIRILKSDVSGNQNNCYWPLHNESIAKTDNDVQNYKQHGSDKQRKQLLQTNEKIKTCYKDKEIKNVKNFFVNV